MPQDYLTEHELRDPNLVLDAISRALKPVKLWESSDGSDLLSLDQAAAMMDCEIDTTLLALSHNRIIGLTSKEGKLGFPEGQFRYDGQPYCEIQDLIEELSGSHCRAYLFLKYTHPIAGGMTGFELLKMSREPILRDIAKNWMVQHSD